ncbi:hypothetical protein [Spirillospora sp. NPDC047279]|uniref:hypothetical protein n=1 Tax=Spirillospora sp. NPDC047279 TaxID=3155478 RepID=UPI0033EBECD0
MTSERPQPEHPRPRSLTDPDAFDVELSRAEALLRTVEHHRNLARAGRILQIAVPVALLSLVAALTAGEGGTTAALVFAASAAACAVTALWAQASVIAPLTRSAARDEGAMVEIVNTLREFLSSMDDNGDASRYRLLRVRVERFPMAPRNLR